jgi:hypothetical protein
MREHDVDYRAHYRDQSQARIYLGDLARGRELEKLGSWDMTYWRISFAIKIVLFSLIFIVSPQRPTWGHFVYTIQVCQADFKNQRKNHRFFLAKQIRQ